MQKGTSKIGDSSEVNLLNRLSERFDRHEKQLNEAYDKVQKIEERLEEIETEKGALLAEQEKLQMTIEILEPIHAEEQVDFDNMRKGDWDAIAGLGIQEYCRRIVHETKTAINAAGIRDALVAHGVKLDYANPLAVIHTSIKRLSEEIRSFRQQEDNGNGKKTWVRYYEWIR